MRRYLLFSFHGYGSNGSNMRNMALSFIEGLSNVDIISPDGIEPFEDMPWHEGARMWFSLRNNTRYIMQELACAAASKFLPRILEKAKEYDVLEENIILSGFSQGAMLAWELAKILPRVPRAIIGLSGLILTPALTINPSRADDLNKKTSILFCHGDLDNVIPIQDMKISLSALKGRCINYELFIDRGAMHVITDNMVRKIRYFLRKIIL
ncbi:alpha/beta hydrolase [Candidatus Fokinia crypta]|uniref:Hydrolase n=1 Tax=Candidatus Fokinia crypta TaxID=1920990 RepID=A0ABZ0UP88_9RICK|nr:dienelactone hydrolase family protein [Candidatus Fokinia cryptica]WPX97946.1 Putative hydrolase [Candidatus Fokinia cryptica]